MAPAETMAEVPIPEAIVGAFIGKGGSGLRHLGRTSGCKINMPRREAGDTSSDRCVQLSGTPERVQQGLLLLQQMLGQLAQQAAACRACKAKPTKAQHATYSSMPMMAPSAMQPMQPAMQSAAAAMPAPPMGMPGAMGVQSRLGVQGGACLGMPAQHAAGPAAAAGVPEPRCRRNDGACVPMARAAWAPGLGAPSAAAPTLAAALTPVTEP